jgi:chemotaxis protein MotA
MFAAIGIIIVLVMVFGGFMVAGGSMDVVLHALPLEMMIIGGAALGATVAGNSFSQLKAIGGGFGKVFKGPRYARQDYLDTIFLVSKLMKMLRTEGPRRRRAAYRGSPVEQHLREYPKLLKDKTLIHLVCDTLRLVVVSSGTLNPHAVEEVMDNAIKTHHHEAHAAGHFAADPVRRPARARHRAAVLGVIKTMGSIDKPPAVLGGMIGSALVGTFLGVLLSYGFVGPFAEPRPPGRGERRGHLRRGQADHHRLAPGPSPAAGDRSRPLGDCPHEPARLRRCLRRHAGPVKDGHFSPRPQRAAASRHRRQEDRASEPRAASWRRLEDRLCRFRDGHDGLLPADVAGGRDRRAAAPGPGRLFHPDPDRI